MLSLTAVTPHIHRLTIPFLDVYTTVFIIDTPNGFVLFDTATYPDDAEQYILPAMRQLGIAPGSLHCVAISHNHRDHAGSLARILQEFPHISVLSASTALRQQFPDAAYLCAENNASLLDVLRVISIPGHTGDCIALLDTRTGTLLSGDGLQLYGIYGSGNWGANITHPDAHRRTIDFLRTLGLSTIIASHDYHPCGHIARGTEEIDAYLTACTNALDDIRESILQNPTLDDKALAAAYNQSSGLPTVAAHVFAAMRKTIE